MKRLFGILAILAILVVATVSFASADEVGPIEPLNPPPSAETGEMVNETPQLWFVEFYGAPLADGGRASRIQTDQSRFRSAAAYLGMEYTERGAFSTLWNGISIQVDARNIAKLYRVPGVKAVYPVAEIEAPIVTDGTIDPDLVTALAMTGADVAQSELGLTGAGVKVAIMDTGIDYDHPDLGGCFGPGCRVFTGWDFVGDDFNADSTDPAYNPITVPDDDPDDCQGHGTHVSGIVGANGDVVGVAPGVSFGAYRVFGCEGSTFADIMLAAMERAYLDGMQVLNMSIGSAFQWPNYPTAQAASRLVDKGMVVVASAGNSGSSGLYATGAPALGAKVISVASVDNTHSLLSYFEVNGTAIGYVPMTYAGPTPTSGTEEIVWIGRACDGDPLEGDPTGKVALITRGACSFNMKATNAINAGATGVVIHNSSSGVFNGTLGSPIDGVTPVVGISLEDGLFIREQATPTYMTWTDQKASFPSPTGGLISSFSSYGLSPDLTLKPDISAPGGSIYSTYPLEKGGYATLGGTSMSAPHVAGAAALLLEAKPLTSPLIVRDILQNSADPFVWWGNPGLGLLDNVHRQGAGMLDIDDAIMATVKVVPGKISLGESEAGPSVQNLTIWNKGKDAVTFDVSFENALSTGGTIAPSFWFSDAFVDFDKTTLTIGGGKRGYLSATIYPATGPDLGQYGGYIVLTPQDGGQVYRVPFAGFIGDYQDITVLEPTVYEMPWVSVLLDGSFYKIEGPDDWYFTMEGDDIPYFLIHFEHQSTMFYIEVFEAGTDKSWYFADGDQYMPRNSSATGFFAFPWDGTTLNRSYKMFTVPDGQYYVKVNVLKALGDYYNPADWESWTSPVFTIDRP